MGVSGQRHAPAALFHPGKGPPVPIGQEDGWAPEPVWTQRLEEKSVAPCQGSNPDRPVVQPVVGHYTVWANPAPLYARYYDDFAQHWKGRSYEHFREVSYLWNTKQEMHLNDTFTDITSLIFETLGKLVGKKKQF
jgi:hypothetical protein